MPHDDDENLVSWWEGVRRVWRDDSPARVELDASVDALRQDHAERASEIRATAERQIAEDLAATHAAELALSASARRSRGE
jgi:hypothetical protein